jgi:3-oxoacyl-[acyl-carrier protein] reductase
MILKALRRKLETTKKEIPDYMATLVGKVAIVTGASRGIGRAIVERLARDGASVVINYSRSVDEATTVLTGVQSRGGVASLCQADIGKVADVRRLFRDTTSRFGQVDIVVNNAATILFKPIEAITEEELDAVFAVNARGPFFMLQEAARLLPAGGRIINISTGATRVGIPLPGAYLGCRGALDQFSLVLSNELGPREITVNTVSAGVTETKMLSDMFAAYPPELKTMLVQRTAMGRLGKPEEVADVVAFLASDDARWITGENISADGGIH